MWSNIKVKCGENNVCPDSYFFNAMADANFTSLGINEDLDQTECHAHEIILLP